MLSVFMFWVGNHLLPWNVWNRYLPLHIWLEWCFCSWPWRYHVYQMCRLCEEASWGQCSGEWHRDALIMTLSGNCVVLKRKPGCATSSLQNSKEPFAFSSNFIIVSLIIFWKHKTFNKLLWKLIETKACWEHLKAISVWLLEMPECVGGWLTVQETRSHRLPTLSSYIISSMAKEM